ncbi:MAG: ferrous iron transport protein A [Phycisphaerae bacterium]|nr:ferrous iron transport protein A [Phycisphaerae bacterium]
MSGEHGQCGRTEPTGDGRRRVSLSQLKPGESGTVCGSELNAGDRRLLSAMGLRERATVVLCRLGEPCIVRVMGGCNCSSRIGLARPLADRVFVNPSRPDGSDRGT